MNSKTVTEIRRVDRVVTAFLNEWTARTKHRHAVGDSLQELESLILNSDDSKVELQTPQLKNISRWLDMYGEAVAGEGVQRSELEVLVQLAEQIVHFHGGSTDPTDSPNAELRSALVDRLVTLIRQGSKELGLEYTPAGLMKASPDSDAEAARARRYLLERLGGFDDIKEAYTRALEFQSERLSYFYQEDTHLLSVLDYQLKNLEARNNPEDAFFAACLLYFLRQHNYSIAPYAERFKKAVGDESAFEMWGAKVS